MKLGIIIPAYKNQKQLDKCKKALKAQKTSVKIEIFVHDNSDENIGFTKAINKGLIHFLGDVDYCLVLNQDCYLEKDCVDQMINFMEKHPKCFIGGVKQLHDKEKDFIIHGGCTEAFPQGKHIIGKVSEGSCNRNKQVPWVNGACMVVRMALIPKVGIMDENFFLLASDSDWCYTARARNQEVWYIADAVVVHEQGISTKRDSMKVEYQKMLDMTYFQDKWLGDGLFRELKMEVFR